MAERTVDGDMAVMFFDDRAAGGQAQTVAFGFGGKVRLKDSLEIGRLDASAMIFDGELHVAAGWKRSELAGGELDVASGNREATAAGHGLATVEHDILDDLSDLDGIGFDRPQVRRDIEDQPHARMLDAQGGGIVEEFRQSDQLFAWCIAFKSAKELFAEIFGAE